ncbi:MAG: HAD family hydrolase [Marivivens sp.]|nr:HAD family hydrolase [Marivivens sp.]
MPHRWTIAFDADDTLWHNEKFFQMSQERFAELLADYVDPHDLRARLLAAERRNLRFYGYGIKGFTLSMIETALAVTDAKLPGHITLALIDMGRDMLAHPINLLPHVDKVIPELANSTQIVLITKGDLLDQERKLAQSNLGDYFSSVEIVSEKTAAVYQRIFARFETPRVMMVGNSLKSDIIPAIEAGGWGIYVPHELTWELEHAEEPEHARYHRLESLGDLPKLIAELA